MDTATINSVIDILLKSGFTLAGAIAVIVGLIIYRRTRSPQLILSRLWLMFNGNSECKVVVVKDILDEQSALLQFRFMTGMQVRNVSQIAAINIWSQTNNENITDIAACGKYFDIEASSLLSRDKLPGNWFKALFCLIPAALAFAAIICLSGILYDKALLSMKSSGTWFTLDSQFAKPLGSAPRFSLSQCATVIAEKNHPGFTPGEVSDICKWSKEKETKEYIESTITAQRWFSGVGLLTCLFMFFPAYNQIMRISKVIEIHRRLDLRNAANLIT